MPHLHGLRTVRGLIVARNMQADMVTEAVVKRGAATRCRAGSW